MITQWTVLTFLATLGFALTHIFAGKLRFLETIPRSKWLSFAGGVSIAYVFVHLFPELNQAQQSFQKNSDGIIRFLKQQIYVLTLLGFVSFYCLERYVKLSGSYKNSARSKKNASSAVFWIHILSFAAYNILIGYLLVYGEMKSSKELLFFFLALTLHFLVNDFGLRDHHRETYDAIGKWILAISIFIGWIFAQITEFDKQDVAFFFAILSGGIILNVLKEELPEDRKSSASAFVFGAFTYSVLLFTV